MDIYTVIHNRRSIRAFKPDSIDDVVLNRIMDAALWAPSALNSQNWIFHVLTGKNRDGFAKLLTPVFEEMKDTILENYGSEAVEVRRKLYTNAGGAPVIIVVYVENGAWNWDKIGPGMACMNILLAAESERLGSLFMGAPIYVKEKVNEFLGVQDAELLGAILLGYPDEEVAPKPRLDNRIIRLK
ncbi:nitroreductase [bacterium]|nr:nitroreductase [bacterium]